MLQLTNTLSGDGPARLHLVSGDELRVITRAEEPLFEDLFHVINPFINCIIELDLIIRIRFALAWPFLTMLLRPSSSIIYYFNLIIIFINRSWKAAQSR